MKNITIKVFSDNGLTYFVKKNNMVAAQLFRLRHLVERTGYQTKIVKGWKKSFTIQKNAWQINPAVLL